MIILTDTREQLPYSFDRWPIEIQTAGLPTGDYSLSGFENQIAVERKSLNDLIGCLIGKNRVRFEKELTHARQYELFAVVIEADFFQIANKNYHSVMNPDAVLQSITAFYIRYKIPFLFCGNRSGAEYMIYSLLQKYLYEIEKRYKQSQKSMKTAIKS